MDDDLRAGDKARVTVASRNELLGGTQKVATEAIRSRSSRVGDLASLGIRSVAWEESEEGGGSCYRPLAIGVTMGVVNRSAATLDYNAWALSMASKYIIRPIIQA